MASIHKRGDVWRAQIYQGGKRTSATFRTQREARAWASEQEVRLRDESTKAPAEIRTVREMLERYEREVSPRKRGHRHESLRIAAFLRDAGLASVPLASVTTQALAAWRDGRGVTPGSVQRDINLLRAAWNVAIREWGWANSNPFSGMRLPGQNPPRTRRILPAEVRQLVRWMGYKTGRPPQTRYQEVALALLVSLRTAMRVGEILSLGSASVDLGRRIAVLDHHKTSEKVGRREVPLSRAAVRLLLPVSHRKRYFSISAASLDALFRKARDSLLIRDLHFHDARAEALTRMARRVDVLTLSRISGHRDLRILQSVYYRESAEHIARRL